MIHFPDSLTVENIDAFHKELLAAFNELSAEKEVILELGSLSYVDFSGVQLIASLCMALRAEGRSVYINRVSSPVKQAFTFSGLDSFIGKGGEI